MIDQVHVDARQHEPGARRDNDQANLITRCARAREGALGCGDREWHCFGCVAHRLLAGRQRHERLLDRTDQVAMRVGQFIGEKADPSLEAWPDLGQQSEDVVATNAMDGHRRAEPVNPDHALEGSLQLRAAVRQRGRPGRCLKNHVRRS